MAKMNICTDSIVASRWVDDGNAETPGRGDYFCAIEVIVAATFDQLISKKIAEYDTDTNSDSKINASDVPSDNSIYINTEDADAGNQLVNTDSFPAGTILYGRWTKFELAGGKVIAYESNK